MSLISVGVDHEHASLDFLEAATVPEHAWSKVLRSLISQRNVHEAVFVSTCLRTEVVAVVDGFHGALDEITATLADATGLDANELRDRLTVHFDRGVVGHLFAVAAGLKSVVPGEHEVLGQLRRALELADEEQCAGRELDDLFHRALACGRRVRAETSIGRGTTSFAQAAVTVVRDELGAGLTGAAVVVVGAGQMSAGVVRGLVAAPEGVGRVTIANRTVARAQRLVDDVADSRLRAAGLDELASLVGDARLVVTAIETPAPVITHAMVASRRTPLLFVDLAVPRAVEAAVDGVSAVSRVDIAHLRERVDRALDGRRDALAEAGDVVAREVERYLTDQRARGAAAIVADLRDHFDEVVAAELARRHGELERFDDEEIEVVRSVVRSVVAKLAHRPTVTLKEAAGTDRGIRLTEAARTLFDL